MSKNISASVRARLLNLAKKKNLDFNQVLVRFALERLLYRISQSPYADRFLLKGALLFTVWYNLPHRPTRDADFLGFGTSDPVSIAQVFREIAAIHVDDGIIFDPNSVSAEEIRKEAGYAGVRVLITAELAGARCKTQADIGFGDVVIPEPLEETYPILLEDLPAPRLRVYSTYTVIAEKLHAAVLFGMGNSRVKDYFDMWVLLEREKLDTEILARSIAATFARRETIVPASLPIGLTEEFANDPSRQTMWNAFLKRNDLNAPSLPDVVVQLKTALEPALKIISQVSNKI